MTLEIMTRDMDAVAYACLKNELNYWFIPTEMTGIVKVRISDKGREVSASLAYRLGVLVQAKIQDDRNKEELPTPETTENNVLYLVEDLPA